MMIFVFLFSFIILSAIFYLLLENSNKNFIKLKNTFFQQKDEVISKKMKQEDKKVVPLLIPREKLPDIPRLPGLLLMRCIAGSHAYGTNSKDSDIDIRGIFVPNKRYILGCTKNVEQIESKPDTVIYAIKKYMNLCKAANPNILELLFVPDDCIIETHPIFYLLHDNRDVFLSQKVRFTYSGYAYSQFKRIKTHRNWLLSPPKRQPKRSDFGLPENKTLISKEQISAFYITLAHILYDSLQLELQSAHKNILQIINSESFPGFEEIINSKGIPEKALQSVQNLTGASDNFIYALKLEQEYYSAMNKWKRYKEWEKNRNKERAKLEKEFGLDLKHVSHLVRLMLQCEELMTTGKLNVRLKNAEQIRAIRSGVWLNGERITYEIVEDFLHKTEEKINSIYKSNESPLPKNPDDYAIDKLCIQIIEQAWQY